jgi:hypothetical protein
MITRVSFRKTFRTVVVILTEREREAEMDTPLRKDDEIP